jgi:hypothetical protein
MIMRRWLIVLLLGVTLACNFPGLPSRPFDTPPTETLTPAPEDEEETTDPESPDADEEVDPTETATATPDMPTATPTETPTPTATPTLTPTAEVVIEPGPPLTFNDPAWELVEWHPVPGTGEWEGTLRLNVTGGTPPYRSQIENKPIVSGLEVTTKWRLCKAMPATVRVWSADGQQAETAIYVWELGCKED